ncbi:hypothetical protein [Algibacter lectus]|uniref:hypothetical protein n=1 Tax=Algibacter lectus TaxID=221126 RepID=UPI0005AB2170|nr:hypothetical protein [Algibacter lectus]
MIGKIVFRLDNWIKRLIYKQYSNNPNIHGDYESFQPIVFKGKGEVRMGDNVKFGVVNSPFFIIHMHTLRLELVFLKLL